MNRPICLLFLVFLAVLLVKSETRIEVDENGDEYDVKRFRIPGRNLNEGRSQCVEVRRKRATASQPQAAYSDDASNDESSSDKTNESDVIKDDDEPPMLFYSPPVISAAADDENDEDNEMNKEGEEVTLSYMDRKNDTKSEDDQELEADKRKEKVDEETFDVVQLPKLPILGQLQGDGESVTAIASAPGVEDEADTDGIVVVQSHSPPKINPETHAVFELVPVKDEITETGNAEEDLYGEIFGGEYDFDFNEELSPISTSAIWSTGDDIYDNFDEKPLRVRKVKKTNQNKNTKKPNRKNKYDNSLRQGLTSANKKTNKNRKRPNKSNVNRPNKKQKGGSSNNTRRRNPPKKNQTLIRKQNKNKNTQNSFLNNRNSNYNKRNRLIAKRNKNKKNAEVVDNGENTFTRTFTWTKTGDDDGDTNTNCIIIRKDPPPSTTERPFWNFWGRNNKGARQASDHFGLRKRANVQFVA